LEGKGSSREGKGTQGEKTMSERRREKSKGITEGKNSTRNRNKKKPARKDVERRTKGGGI